MEVQKNLGRFQKYNTQIKIVSFAKPEALRPYARLHQWKFEILADPEKNAYRLFHFERKSIFHLKTIAKFFGLMLKGYKLEKTTEDVYQMGGDVWVDAKGIIRWVHASQRPDDRPTVTELLRKIEEIS